MHVSLDVHNGFDSHDSHDAHDSFCSGLRGKAHLKDLHGCRSFTNDQADRIVQCERIRDGGLREQ